MGKKRKKRCYCGIGGQAVLEGVMMKNQDSYAVAVRRPDGEIELKKEDYKGIWGDKKITKIPFLRGVFNFYRLAGAWHEHTDLVGAVF